MAANKKDKSTHSFSTFIIKDWVNAQQQWWQVCLPCLLTQYHLGDHEARTQLVLWLCYVFYVCWFVYLCIHTYRVHSNYVTYIVAMALCDYTLVNL